MADTDPTTPREAPASPSIFPEHIRRRQRERLRRALARALADGFSGKIAPPAEASKEEQGRAD